MKRLLTFSLVSILVLPLFAAAPEASPNYFKRVRPVTSPAVGKDNFIALDADIWGHNNGTLGDIRLYTADGREVAYKLEEAELSGDEAQLPVHMMELGRAGAGTRFVLDMGSDSEFNRVTLQLATHDFVGQATVEGLHELTDKTPTKLGPYTLYDFEKEKLGSNSILKLPDSRFRYLRITLTKEIPPADVKGATVARAREGRTLYTDWPVIPQIKQESHNTVITWDAAPGVPLDRVLFEVDGVNFMRPARLEAEECDQEKKCAFREVSSGEISRIQMTRNGREVKTENLTLGLGGRRAGKYRLIIDNGSDVPLHITRVQPASIERRIYFRPDTANLQLFYGDEKLGPPVYDYAKLFDESQAKNAIAAALGAAADNVGYTARPDDRPWSDRHPALLWVVLVLAVVGLGSVALRGLKA